MKKFQAIIFIFVVLFSYRHKIFSTFKSRHVPQSLTKQGNCQGRELCGIVYVAPWCPACHQMEPLIKEALTNSRNHVYGLQVIVGAGRDNQENLMKAKELGEDVIVDADGIYAKGLNISYFPTILVVDQNQKVQKEGRDAHVWLEHLAGD